MDTASRIPAGAHKGAGVSAMPRDKEEGVSRARRTSLPSEEYEGAQPGEKSGGVGSLPGHLSESSVALLPDEREAQARELEGTEHPDQKELKTAAIPPIKAGEKTRAGPTSSSQGERVPGVPKRKTSLKEKVTDGMKAAMGKLKGDDETFAQGETQRRH
ncbi:hypothetical protein RSOLAG22IIIB_05419 [Rhizoctonia solani]|uniref:Uncharacterized protein n=1 Tax=Rhizoctonia solani TaxID=456999 RepID=A0A0K6G6Z8_9AGAM|nr:hypothetical protein RSOLAG22IIIB_05419 [Rhizoctonia solani]